MQRLTSLQTGSMYPGLNGTTSAPPAGSNVVRPSDSRLAQTQVQVDQVVGIMRNNIDKVLERDQKLTLIGDRADALQEGATQFERSAATLRRKYWWKNVKMMVVLGVVLFLLVLIILMWATKN